MDSDVRLAGSPRQVLHSDVRVYFIFRCRVLGSNPSDTPLAFCLYKTSPHKKAAHRLPGQSKRDSKDLVT